ncbi:GspH/FimT family pseudopilin [Maliponia aquimaris]|uniref:Type II secretion system protein H n=1 Tax=Maliponia aquimaris TaxID=1673631 RepID=A0A238KE91_9RHOB|nr:GspH/FimT family pseudopilin [Maliponia aquimaris]SMX40804.1 hypothetical protein MAA8898_02258 [Maliponia aquimaris]
MDAGLTGTRGAQAGFSLLELMVSIAILSILAVGVGLATGRGVAGAERDADRFRRAVEQTRALAILERAPRGLSVTPGDLHLMRRDDSGWTADPLHGWSSRASLLPSGPVPPPGTPDILFHPDGSSSGFSATFSGRGATWRCASDGWSEMTCAAD